MPEWVQGWMGLSRIKEEYAQLAKTGLARSLLRRLQVRIAVSDHELAHIPPSGPAVVVANHPHGMLDGAVLMELLGHVRSDVKFLANRLLLGIPELRDHIIAVDVDGGRVNAAAVREAVGFTAGGGLLVIFPAGEVSHWRAGVGVADPEWQQGTARLLRLIRRRCETLTVVPLHIVGRNSALFQMCGMISPKLRTALLVRELWNKEGRTVELRIGKPVLFDPEAHTLEQLRRRVDLLGKREAFRAMTNKPLRRVASARHEPVIAPVEASALAAEVSALPVLLESGPLAAYIATADRIPRTLREIGRLREITFRAAGEGTGRAVDLDSFDAHYLHLFLWDKEQQRIAGAYRLKAVHPRRTRVAELYTSTLFHYSEQFLREMGPSLELGRSFVRAEYQKSYSALLLLWKAIGAWVAAHPEHRILFGPVSISNSYTPESRRLIFSFLRQAAWIAEWTGLVRGRRNPRWNPDPVALRDVDELDEAVAEMEGAPAGVPVLLRQYLKLGGRLVGFHLDAAFSNVLDGMIVVDLMRTESKLLQRYLGKEGARRFVSFHQDKEEMGQWKAAS